MPVGQNPPAHHKTLKGAKKKREKQLKVAGVGSSSQAVAQARGSYF